MLVDFSAKRTLGGFFLWFYLGWIIPTIALYFFPLPDHITSFQHQLTGFFIIASYLLYASSLSRKIIAIVVLEEKKNIYFASILALMVMAVLYFYGRFFSDFKIIVAAISTANLLFLASIVGTGLSSAITRVGELVPLCITAATADLVSVLRGPTSELIENISTYYSEGMQGAPPVVDFFIIKVAIPGYSVPMPLFGVTDWILIILLSSALFRLGKKDNILEGIGYVNSFVRLPVASFALFMALVFAQVTQRYVPAMVFISIIFLLYLFIVLRVNGELHRRDIVYSLIFPAAVAAIIFLANP